MSSKKREVNVTIKDAEDAEIITAARSISVGEGEVPQGQAADSVIVDLTNIKRVNIATAGLDIVRFNSTAAPLDELAGLLVSALENQDDKRDVEDIAADLLEQAQKPDQDKNYSKIKRLVDGLSRYIGLATLAATQIENAQQLVEKVQLLLTGGR